MNNNRTIVLLLVGLVIIIAASLFVFRTESRTLISKCPDEWIEDRMPGVEGEKTEKQYFIINGERREIKDYDLEWIGNNCSVQVQYVY